MGVQMTTRDPAVHQIISHVVLTLLIHEEDGQYVSRCSELGTASCGDTIDEALQNIKEATLLYVNSLEATGELERIFRRKGIQVYVGPPHEADTLVKVNTADTVAFLVHAISGAPERHGSPAAAV